MAYSMKQAILLAYTFTSFCLASNAQCPLTEMQDIYNIQYVESKKKNKGYYIPAKNEKLSDTLNQWVLYKSDGNGCKLVVRNSFSHIFDYRVYEDTLISVLGARTFKDRNKRDSSTIGLYLLSRHDPSTVTFIRISELHYYAFDDNDLVGVTTYDGAVTGYLSAKGAMAFQTIDAAPLANVRLYPSQASGAFIVRDLSTDKFTLGLQNATDIRKLVSNNDFLYTQRGHIYITGNETACEYYHISKATQQGLRAFTRGGVFEPGSAVAIARQGEQWFAVDSADLSIKPITCPDSLGTITDISVIPHSSNIILTTSKKGKWWRSVEGSDGFKKAPIPDSATVFALFKEWVAYTINGTDEVSFINLGKDQPALSLKTLKSFRVLQSHLLPSKHGLLTAEFDSSGVRKGVAVYINTKQNRVSRLVNYALHTQYLSLNRYFVFKPVDSLYYQVRDVEKMIAGESNTIIGNKDHLVVIKPFLTVEKKTLAKGTVAVSDCEDCAAIIEVANNAATISSRQKSSTPQ